MPFWNSPGDRRATARRPRPYRPRLEVLESRTLLSVCTVDRLTDNNPNGGGEGNGGLGDLRWCVVESLSQADTINFSVTGTINLAAVLPTLTRSVSIDGPGASLLTVRPNTSYAFNLFTVAPAVTVGISGLTLSNGGNYNGGGAIYNNGMLTVSDSVISGNSALGGSYFNGNSGGGVFNSDNGSLTVNYSTISGNSASAGGSGGGIFNINGSLTVSDSVISANSTSYGGGGGGIENYYGTLTVNYSTISGNSGSGGAGIWNLGTLTLNGSTISGNTGGGIYNGYPGTLTVSDSTIANNTAAFGGGVDNGGARFTINNSTVAGNSATYSGGGIYTNIIGDTLAPRNTIIAGNTAPYAGPDVYGNLGSQGHNLIGNPQDMTGWVASDLLHVNPMLGPLADNGGPTLTRALLPGSPAIDAGDNTAAPMWDQRGAPFHRIVNGVIDIGAYELQARGHGGPTGQPLPDPVPVQVLGTPADPLSGQLPTPPADSTPLVGTAAPDGQAGQPGTDLVPGPTVGGQPAAEAFTADAGNGQPVDTLGPLDGIPVELPTLGL
jgi:hypothetical protein